MSDCRWGFGLIIRFIYPLQLVTKINAMADVQLPLRFQTVPVIQPLLLCNNYSPSTESLYAIERGCLFTDSSPVNLHACNFSAWTAGKLCSLLLHHSDHAETPDLCSSIVESVTFAAIA
jgi:hypothetical protein